VWWLAEEECSRIEAGGGEGTSGGNRKTGRCVTEERWTDPNPVETTKSNPSRVMKGGGCKGPFGLRRIWRIGNQHRNAWGSGAYLLGIVLWVSNLTFAVFAFFAFRLLAKYFEFGIDVVLSGQGESLIPHLLHLRLLGVALAVSDLMFFVFICYRAFVPLCKSTVRGFMDAALTGEEVTRYCADGVDGSGVTQRKPVSYKIENVVRNVPDDLATVRVTFPTYGPECCDRKAGEESATVKFAVRRGKIVSIDGI